MDYNYSNLKKKNNFQHNSETKSIGCVNYKKNNNKLNTSLYGKHIYNKEYWDKYLTWTKQNL